jgi:hypothetical protein
MLAFLCLAAFKFFAVISSDGANASAALFYFAMFGAPQLVWLWLLRRPLPSRGQARVAVFIAAAFLCTSCYFGSFPGTTAPSWGGEGQFEVPIAFLLEWLVSIVGVLVFTARGRKQPAGDA